LAEAVAARRGISVGRQVPTRDSRYQNLARRPETSSGCYFTGIPQS